tara:strand:+ start:290 stop:511 length:222 start_codon:yes stop_codon:yes gene_type:complete
LKNIIADSMMSYLAGKVKYHKANVLIYMKSPVGIGEHPDILGAIEEELSKAAEYAEKYAMLGEILMGNDVDGG